MNENLTWLSHLLDQARESLGLARCHTGFVREERDQVRFLWNDECGRDFSRRYLDPIEENWTACDSRIESQQTSLLDACSDLGKCSDAAERAIALAQEFARDVNEFRALESQMESQRAHMMQRLQEALKSTVAVSDLLQKAEAAAG